MKQKHFALILAFVCTTILALGVDKKPLHNGYYNAKQLRKRGYDCHFKGKIFVTYKKYLELNKL